LLEAGGKLSCCDLPVTITIHATQASCQRFGDFLLVQDSILVLVEPCEKRLDPLRGIDRGPGSRGCRSLLGMNCPCHQEDREQGGNVTPNKQLTALHESASKGDTLLY
jgi:hypothetical protein